MSYSLEVVGRGWGSKIIETVVRTWDLLCREFCLVWFVQEMKPRALPIQSMHPLLSHTPSPRSF